MAKKAKIDFKILTDDEKASIAAKHDYEGNYLEYAGVGDFKGTEYEERVRQMIGDQEWFEDLMAEFGDASHDHDEEDFDDE